jgi:tungstate transport system ATP-binding protein
MKIDLMGLHKSFDGNNLFSIQEYKFQTGQAYGLIGNNGIGKTTLLRIVSGFDSKYEGTVRFDGQPYTDQTTKKMSYISQKPYMLNRSVRENIAYPLLIRKWNRKAVDREVEVWLDKLGLTDLADRKAIVLSAGEQQKVALARGLIYQPELVLLDEPTANIDPESVKVLEQILSNYQLKTKATIIWVTHNLEQAFRICDQVIVMKKDRLQNISKHSLQASLDSMRKLDRVLNDHEEVEG